MVGSSGLEPPTSRLSGVRSNHLSYEPITILKDGGGDERDRTDDPLLAKQVLSQLSYTPVSDHTSLKFRTLPLLRFTRTLKIKQRFKGFSLKVKHFCLLTLKYEIFLSHFSIERR